MKLLDDVSADFVDGMGPCLSGSFDERTNAANEACLTFSTSWTDVTFQRERAMLAFRSVSLKDPTLLNFRRRVGDITAEFKHPRDAFLAITSASATNCVSALEALIVRVILQPFEVRLALFFAKRTLEHILTSHNNTTGSRVPDVRG
jgi:hypothetical protein